MRIGEILREFVRLREISGDLVRFGVASMYDSVLRANLAGCGVLVNIVTARAGYTAGIERNCEILRDFVRFCENW